MPKGPLTLSYNSYGWYTGHYEKIDSVSVTQAVALTSGVPAAPSGLTAGAAAVAGKVNLSWTANSNNASGFCIERRTGTSGTWGEIIKIVGGSVTSYADKGLTAGATYYYRVRAYKAARNSDYSNKAYATTYAIAVANNNFANATVISGASVTDTGSNVGATKEKGEPNHAGNLGGESVWWTWTAPATVWVQIDTKGSDFSTTLGVYTGSNIPTLAPVVNHYDGSGTGKARFLAVAGTPYRIAVDGYNAASGKITLNIRPRTIAGIIPGTGLDGWKSQINVSLSRVGDGSSAINPNLPTWIVIHGRVDSPDSDAIRGLTNAVNAYATDDQVLVVDWREGAFDNSSATGLEGSRWISKVADWVDETLRLLRIAPASLRLVGHSWGALMSSEIARLQLKNTGSRVQAIVALDPANTPKALGDKYDGGEVNFGLGADRSWAFNSSIYGSNAYAKTAADSFDTEIGNALFPSTHTAVVLLFTQMVSATNNMYVPAASRFSLDRLLSGSGPWATVGGFEATLQATRVNGQWELLSVMYGSSKESILPDIAGRTPQTADAISIGTTVRNWVGTANTLDYFRFTLSSSRLIRVSVNTLDSSGEASVSLVNSAGFAVQPGLVVGTALLPAGTYYIKVAPFAGCNTIYDLSLAYALNPISTGEF